MFCVTAGLSVIPGIESYGLLPSYKGIDGSSSSLGGVVPVDAATTRKIFVAVNLDDDLYHPLRSSCELASVTPWAFNH